MYRSRKYNIITIAMQTLNGYDREAMLSEGSKAMGIMEFCYSAASGEVHVIGSGDISFPTNNNYVLETSRTTFADGSPLADRTLCRTPDPTLNVYGFVRKGVDIHISGSKKLQVAVDFKGYIYTDDVNNLIANVSLTPDELIKNTILEAQLYINEHLNELVWFGDERHGSDQSGEAHLQAHGFPGFWRQFGLDATGFTIGSSTFTSISQGVCSDEDIAALIRTHSTIPKMYMVGPNHEWTITDDDNKYCKFDTGIAVWNDISGADAILTQITGNDRSNMILIASNNKLAPLVTVVGQELYSNNADAANKADSAWVRLVDIGLPSHEFARVYMGIISSTGAIQAGADGETGWDYRQGYPAKIF